MFERCPSLPSIRTTLLVTLFTGSEPYYLQNVIPNSILPAVHIQRVRIMSELYELTTWYRWEHSIPTASVAIIAIFIFSLLRTIQSPLSTLPGTWHSRWTSLVLLWHEYHGSRRLYVHSLHQKYGPTVRLGPKEVSFTGAGAIKSIYGAKGYTKPRLYDLFTQHGTR